MIEKKPLINTIKRALQTGTFNYIGQETKQIPKELFHIDQINFEEQNWWQCLPITKLDLSNNEISEILPQINNLPEIQLIRMKNNKLTSLHVNVLLLEHIKVIDLTKNYLTQIPSQLSFNKTLVELNFAQNNLQFCPDLSNLQTLENLFINDNQLKQLPNFGIALKKLQASNNKIRLIKRSNFYKSNLLETLNLNKNMIEAIEIGSFAQISNLIILQMKQNRLNSFEQIPKSLQLDTINLAYNNLKQYNYFDNSPNLTVLILSNNKLTKLSKDILKLQKIKTLDLENNDLSELPCEMGFINSLVRLQVEGNPLKSIRQNIRNGGTNVLKKYLKDRMPPQQQSMLQKKFSSSFEQQSSQKQYWAKLINQFSQAGELILKNMKLQSIDSLVYTKNLKGLNLSDNQIKQLSEEIAQLSQLKYLVVNKNVFELLPASLGTIVTLESIEAKNNKLSMFGSLKNNSLNRFPALRHLDLSGNKFTEISKPILLLNNLHTFYISYNQIRSIDEVFHKGALPFLEVLDASNNALTQLSDEVYGKATLNFLNIENNSLSKIPTLLGFMKLSSLKVDGNPLKLIKRTVIEKGTVALLDFLRTKHVGQIPQLIEFPAFEQIQVEQPQQKWPYQQKKQMIPQNINKKQQYSQKVPGNFYQQQQVSKKMFQEYSPIQNRQLKENINEKIRQIQKQVSEIQYELENNYGLSNVKKNEKRKNLQALMIEKNKLLKEREEY